MSKTNDSNLDDASHGGGIGDISRQPVDQSSDNLGNGEPVILPDDEDGVGAIEDDDLVGGDNDAITVDDDEDPDEDADSTQGVLI